MAEKFVCRLDGEKGTIADLVREDYIFSVNCGDSIEFQIEGGSFLAEEETCLLISENNSEVLVHKGTLISGHWVCRIIFEVPGSIKLNIVYRDFKSLSEYIIVNPTVTLASTQIPLESLSIQTVLSRNLGDFAKWKGILMDQKNLGYNFFHITPIQELGGSNSLYCIKDPNEINSLFLPGASTQEKFEKLEEIVNSLDSQGVGCVVDIVLNHCAFDSEFIEEHPEAGYNLENSPYLTVAYELDKALYEFTKAIIQKSMRSLHNKTKIETEKDLNAIMQILKLEVLPPLKLHQYFQMDFDTVLKKFENETEEEEISAVGLEDLKTKGLEYFIRTYCLLKEGEGKCSTEINTKLVWKACRTLGHSKETSIKELKKALPIVNSFLLNRFNNHFAEILTNIEGDIRYHKLEEGEIEITPSNPIVRRYFQELNNGHIVLHNGFIMGNREVLKDFAGKDGWHYFRRNVIVWADNIKLRYGNKFEDSPALWEKMERYVTSMARIFKGLRLDNAHGTPLHLSSYMLNAARKVNPNLFVMAELFTSDRKLDAYFVKILGINGLVREAFSIREPYQQGGQVYEYGKGETSSLGKLEEHSLNNRSLLGFSRLSKLTAKAVPCIYYDCTHDNPSPSELRKPHDALSNAAIVSMTNCAIASTRGYDEFLPKQLSVVTERRLYAQYSATQYNFHDLGGNVIIYISYSHDVSQKIHNVKVKGEWDDWKTFFELVRVSENNFVIEFRLPDHFIGRELAYKFVLNDSNWVHDPKQPYKKYGNNINNYIKVSAAPNIITGIYPTMRPGREVLNKLHTQLSVEKYEEIYVHQCSKDIIMIIRQNPKDGSSYVLVTRTAYWNDDNPVAEYNIRLPGVVNKLVFLSVLSFKTLKFNDDPMHIKGLTGNLEVLSNLEEFGKLFRDANENIDVLNLDKVPQGFVCILRTEIVSQEYLKSLNGIYEDLEESADIYNGTTLEAMNHLFWRCGNEELDISYRKRDVYKIPNYRDFNYAGIGSLVAEFLALIKAGSLGDEMCNNIRAGNWLIDYIHSRLESYLPTPLYDFIRGSLDHIKKLPRAIIPKHLSKFILRLFEAGKQYQIQVLFGLVPRTRLEEYLYASVTQFWGSVPSAANHLYPTSMSAGLPHFSTGFMRVWGRDTFIAFNGLLICTQRWAEAKQLILTFASVVRHGLIPNLLDSGRNCRYNARDATWFYMYSIKNYIEKAPNGINILREKVSMVFKSDVQEEHYRNHNEILVTLEDVVQRILQDHAYGISFREWNAGNAIDANMRDEGFNVRIKLNPDNGFVYGGNRWNCGTWMDKMGSSHKANNAGVPATPRDGAPIELTALLYSSVTFIAQLNAESKFKYDGVYLPDGKKLLYAEWSQKIKNNFESSYYIPETSYKISGYYKDNLGSQIPQTDLQLRPNMCVALAVSPDLFEPAHAVIALKVVREELMPGLGTGQIGIRTLNDMDNAYRNFYDNSNDTTDTSIAQGFSYHNGPEWVWPVGYYLLSVLHFTNDKKLIMKCLTQHLSYIEKSSWMSLPELTNGFGSTCKFSCDAQAWSVATLIEVLQKLN